MMEFQRFCQIDGDKITVELNFKPVGSRVNVQLIKKLAKRFIIFSSKNYFQKIRKKNG